jgi:hypothetical protein
MGIIYHVITKGYLHRSKKLFDCRCKAYEYVQQILEMCSRKLERDEVKMSLSIARIDDEVVPNYKKLFMEQEVSEPFLDEEEATE